MTRKTASRIEFIIFIELLSLDIFLIRPLELNPAFRFLFMDKVHAPLINRAAISRFPGTSPRSVFRTTVEQKRQYGARPSWSKAVLHQDTGGRLAVDDEQNTGNQCTDCRDNVKYCTKTYTK